MPPTDHRHPIPPEIIVGAIASVKQKLAQRLQEKGRGTFISSHEIRGIIDEEVEELHDAIRDNSPNSIYGELLDIAVGAVFGMACISAHWHEEATTGKGSMDWL